MTKAVNCQQHFMQYTLEVVQNNYYFCNFVKEKIKLCLHGLHQLGQPLGGSWVNE